VRTPTWRSDARSVRAANAVPIWQATMPRNVIVVAWTYTECSDDPVPTGSPQCHPPPTSTKKKPAMTRPALMRPRKTHARNSIGRWMIPSSRGRGARLISPGSAGSRPSASAGNVSVPRSMARIWSTVRGSGIAPPLSA
jgi:hypothetical protein